MSRAYEAEFDRGQGMPDPRGRSRVMVSTSGSIFQTMCVAWTGMGDPSVISDTVRPGRLDNSAIRVREL